MSFGKPITTTSLVRVEPLDHSIPAPTPRVVNWGANNVAFCDKHDKHGVCHKCNAEKKAK